MTRLRRLWGHRRRGADVDPSTEVKQTADQLKDDAAFDPRVIDRLWAIGIEEGLLDEAGPRPRISGRPTTAPAPAVGENRTPANNAVAPDATRLKAEPLAIHRYPLARPVAGSAKRRPVAGSPTRRPVAGRAKRRPVARSAKRSRRIWKVVLPFAMLVCALSGLYIVKARCPWCEAPLGTYRVAAIKITVPITKDPNAPAVQMRLNLSSRTAGDPVTSGTFKGYRFKFDTKDASATISGTHLISLGRAEAIVIFFEGSCTSAQIRVNGAPVPLSFDEQEIQNKTITPKTNWAANTRNPEVDISIMPPSADSPDNSGADQSASCGVWWAPAPRDPATPVTPPSV